MLSIAIIAKDEERYIGGCIDSVVGIADEVLVLLDERTSDTTAAICRSKGVRLFIEPWRGFPKQRDRALALCEQPWVLFIDADERLTPELGDEIRSVLANDKETGRQGDRETGRCAVSLSPCLPVSLSGYWIPRYNLFFGQRLRGGGWYPDYQLRLLRRGSARYDEGQLVHEVAALDGSAAYLTNHLLHYNIDRLDEFWRKQTDFARFEADSLYRSGRRARARNFVGAPTRELWRRFIQLGGWRDGPLGLFLCGALAWFEIITFLRLWGLQRIHRRERA